MDGAHSLSLGELERLLLQRRRSQALAGLRRISLPLAEEPAPVDRRAPAPRGLERPPGRPLRRPRPSSVLPPPDLSIEPFPTAEEPWLHRPSAHLHPFPPRRQRRPVPRALVVLKKGLASVIDGLIVLALILFVIALGFTLYDTYVGRLLHRSAPSVVRAQGTTWAWQGRLAPPAEDLTSAPLPFVPYSTTIALQPRDIPPPTPAPGLENPTRLLIPRIQLDTPVVEVTIENGVWQVAEYAAGYHRGSARPGTLGNTVISGHKGLYGAVFLR
ncbi:MAG: sortase, partial [Chloroflexia bacterium]